MKIAVIYGQSHKGITYTLAHTVLQYLMTAQDELKEFFLPTDGPAFAMDATAVFLR